MILSSGLYLKVQERGDKARSAEGLPPEERLTVPFPPGGGP